jgi:hypothetical protein
MTYVEIKCTHLYHGTNHSEETEEEEFILNLNEIAFIRPYIYPSIYAYDKVMKCEIALKGIDCQHHTILVSQECCKGIRKTLKQMGELEKIVE